MSAETHPAFPSDLGPVELSVPLRAEHAATVRTVAASLGADAGFSVDELDDIRLALSEVFSALADDAENAPGSRAQVSFALDADAIRIEVRTERDATAIDLDELALGILHSVTDEFEVRSDAIAFAKRATEAIADASTS